MLTENMISRSFPTRRSSDLNDFQVTNNSSDEENLNLSWSPDGSHIVFERNTQNFQVGNLYEIFSIKTDGTELTRHTNNEEDPLVRDSEPVWSPL